MRTSEDHRNYLEQLKSWIRTELVGCQRTGTREELERALKLLRKFQVRVDEAERADLRQLIEQGFGISAEEALQWIPKQEGAAPVYQDGRGPVPIPSGYMQEYTAVTEGQESPHEFHVFALLTCLGAALGRRVWLDMTFFKVWPNLSVVLTGPAGGPRKTMAWDMAHETVRSAFRDWRTPPISDASPAALVEDLAHAGKDAAGLILAPEFRTFFPSQNYMEGAIPLITRLLDSPDSYNPSRITRKATTLRNVTLSIAGGSTLDWMAKLPSDAQGGGFLTRVILVHAELPKPPRSSPQRASPKHAALVMKCLSEIAEYARGEVRLTKEAKGWYDIWYKGLKKQAVASPRLALYYNRKQMHLLRVAMLLNLPSRELKAEDLERALALLDWIEGPLPDVYRVIGMSKAGEMTRALLEALRAVGGRAPFATMMREMKGIMNTRDFRQAVETLRDAGQLLEISNPIEHDLVLRDVGMVE